MTDIDQLASATSAMNVCPVCICYYQSGYSILTKYLIIQLPRTSRRHESSRRMHSSSPVPGGRLSARSMSCMLPHSSNPPAVPTQAAGAAHPDMISNEDKNSLMPVSFPSTRSSAGEGVRILPTLMSDECILSAHYYYITLACQISFSSCAKLIVFLFQGYLNQPDKLILDTGKGDQIVE